MFTYVFHQLVKGFRRSWVLYLSNTLSIALIVFLFAYIDGSKRQLDLQRTVFSGEVVFNLTPSAPSQSAEQIETQLRPAISSLAYTTQKIHTEAQYFLPGNLVGSCELIGMNFDRETKLKSYLTIEDGQYPKDSREILLPSSMLQKTDFKIGDFVRLIGKTASNYTNSARYKIVGIYNSPALSLFSTPQFLVPYSAAEEFYQPEQKNIEYGLFFTSEVPDQINKVLNDTLKDNGTVIVDNVQTNRVSSWEFQNISVQFNVFLLIMILLTVFVVITVVLLVNFNIFMVLLRNRQKEFGTLLAFGVKNTKIALSFLIETVFMVAISFVFAWVFTNLIAVLSSSQRAKGTLEVLFVLLSGTNKVDFFLQPYQFVLATSLILASAIVAQIQGIVKLTFATPQSYLVRK